MDAAPFAPDRSGSVIAATGRFVAIVCWLLLAYLLVAGILGLGSLP